MKKILQRSSFLFLLLILACSGSGDDEGQTNQYISLFISSTEGFVGETIIFSVFDGEGNNVSSSTDFYVDDVKILSNTHTFNSIGAFNVYARNGELISETIIVEIMPTPITFKQNAVVEDFTGTWCGWCPRVSEAVRLLKQETSDAIVVAIHNGDPMQFSREGTIRAAFNVTGFPTALINRQERWASPQPSNVSQVTSKIGSKSYASLAMESTVSDDVLDLKVKVMMGYSYKSMKLAVYMLEDGLVYDQRNFTSYYGDADPIRDFVHDDVLRRSLTDVFGDDIPQDQVGHNKTFTRDFQYAIPPSYDKNKVKLVAFVTTGAERDIVNVRQSKLGETQDFQPID